MYCVSHSSALTIIASSYFLSCSEVNKIGSLISMVNDLSRYLMQLLVAFEPYAAVFQEMPGGRWSPIQIK